MTVTDIHPREPGAEQPRAPAESVPAVDDAAEAPVTLVLADPGTLVLDANVRLDPRLDKPFLDSIRDLGVLVPVVAHRTPAGEVRVLFGQRRTLAAVETGRPQIPVYVIDLPDDEQAREVARIVGQVAENDDRTGSSL